MSNPQMSQLDRYMSCFFGDGNALNAVDGIGGLFGALAFGYL